MTPKTIRTVSVGCALIAAITLAACGGDNGTATAADQAPARPSAEAGSTSQPLSANNATEAELQTIPGVGENIAHEIAEYRPYDVATGPAKFRDEMSKYIDADEIEAIIQYLDFEN